MTSAEVIPSARSHLALVDDASTSAPIKNLAFAGTDDPADALPAALATEDEMTAVVGMHMAKSGFSVSSTYEFEKDPRFSLTIGLARTANHPDLLVAGTPDHRALAQHLGDRVVRDGELTADVLAEDEITIRDVHPSWHDTEYVEDWIEHFGRPPEPGEFVQIVPGPIIGDDPGNPPDLSKPCHQIGQRLNQTDPPMR